MLETGTILHTGVHTYINTYTHVQMGKQTAEVLERLKRAQNPVRHSWYRVVSSTPFQCFQSLSFSTGAQITRVWFRQNCKSSPQKGKKFCYKNFLSRPKILDLQQVSSKNIRNYESLLWCSSPVTSEIF